MGQVCAKHTQYYEERCPYCEEPEASAVIEVPVWGGCVWDGATRVAAAYDERLRRAMLPPNDGHGAFE